MQNMHARPASTGSPLQLLTCKSLIIIESVKGMQLYNWEFADAHCISRWLPNKELILSKSIFVIGNMNFATTSGVKMR